MNVLALLLAAALASSASGPVKTGPTEKQKDLIKSMEHWALVVPADTQDPGLKELAVRLGVLRKKAGQENIEADLEKKLQSDFDLWKDDVARKLAQSTGRTDFTAYRADLEKGVHGLAIYAEDSKLGQQDLKKVNASVNTLKSIIGPVAADYAFDRARIKGAGSGVGVLAAARAEGSEGTNKFFNFRGWVGQARTIKPDGVQVPFTATPISFSPTTANPAPAMSSDRLSDFISGISKTARKYADKIADSIVSVSKKFGIDEKLQAAFVWAESAFNPNAKSYAGAMGLGQLMPGTARGLGVKNAYDIDQNLRGSAQFVDQLLEKFASPDDIKYTQGLFAMGRDKVRAGRPVKEVWNEICRPVALGTHRPDAHYYCDRIPLGVGNAIAAYNAGGGAVSKYAKGDWRRLPVTRTREAELSGKGYWQTIHYTPKVLRNWFEITVQSAPTPVLA
jgi:hypothetical protein